MARWERDYARLSPAHRRMLGGQPAKFAAVRQRLHTNQHFFRAVLAAFERDSGMVPPEYAAGQQANGSAAHPAGDTAEQPRVSPADVEKARCITPACAAAFQPCSTCSHKSHKCLLCSWQTCSADIVSCWLATCRSQLGAIASSCMRPLQYGTSSICVKCVDLGSANASQVQYVLKNLVRDWSAEGAPERSQSYGRILTQLQRHLRPRLAGADPAAPRPRVLVPGAGLARLCVEIAGLVSCCRGYSSLCVMLCRGDDRSWRFQS